MHYDRKEKIMYFVCSSDLSLIFQKDDFRFIRQTDNEYKDFSDWNINFKDQSFQKIKNKTIDEAEPLERLILQLYKRRYTLNYGVMVKMQFERPYIQSRRKDEDIQW